jgi:hypothetical protein
MSVGSTFNLKLFCCGGLALLLGCGEKTPGHSDDATVAAGGMTTAAGTGNAAGMPAGGLAAGGQGSTAAGAPGTGGNSAAGAGGGSSSGSAGAAGGTGRGGSSSGGAGAGALAGAGGAGAGAAGASAAGAAGTPTLDSRPAFDAAIAALADLDATTLGARYPTAFQAAPTYDPSAIVGFDTLQASSLALTTSEQQALTQKGFVVSANHTFPTFAYGYMSIYSADLPVYISADSILEGVHRSYDALLQTTETSKLITELQSLLDGMRTGLAGGAGAELGSDVQGDVDTYLAVAASLLEGTTLAPVAGGSATDIGNLVDLANQAAGPASVSLFGTSRDEDFSQFKPRGHYTSSTALELYFRAIMWLGRIDFRLLETQPDGSQVFQRRQLDDMLLLNALVTSDLHPHFDTIDDVIRVFVGEPDYMQLAQVGSLLADVGATTLTDAKSVSDQTFEQAIIAGGYGVQRIASHIMVDGIGSTGTLPPTLSFALLGQRYVIDSNVFSNLVFDRVGGGKIARMLPNPLDVAFSVFGNNQAGTLLAPDLAQYPYAPDLAAMRLLVDAHPPEFWQASLYNLWLGALRELSPGAIASGSTAAALPATFKSEPWGRRLLSAELASWAELRHDTIAYSKQSYSGASFCDFPDGFVDPYPEFYQKLLDFAALAKTTVLPFFEGSDLLSTEVSTYFDNLTQAATELQAIAEQELTGAPLSQDMLDFLNDAVVVNGGCGSPQQTSGWYKKLFFVLGDGAVWDPTIADVHTEPTDALGNPVGNVLHVGTGDARLMVVVVDTCSGSHVYTGLASSYQEIVMPNFQRLDDPTWATMVRTEPDVPWMTDVVTH